MKEFIARQRVASMLVLLLAVAASTQAQAEEPLRVLFIGNSYTYGHQLPELVARMAKAGKVREISQRSVVGGGMTLEGHLKNGKAVDRITKGKWDVIVLQDQSMRPVVDPAGTKKFARLLNAEIKKTGARTMFFLTWAREKRPQMQEKLNETYGSLAEELKAEVAPVGVAWRLAREANPKMKLHAGDGSHASPHGAYLAACVFYASLIGKSPEGLPVLIRGVSKQEAALLQKIAWQSISTWSKIKPKAVEQQKLKVGRSGGMRAAEQHAMKANAVPRKRGTPTIATEQLFLDQGVFFLGDHRQLQRHLGVQFGEACPLFRNVVFVEDGFDGTFRDAGFAVDALVGMDVENQFAFVETLDGANDDAIGVLAIEARFANDMSHSN
jgi:hypothetical protein